MRILIGCEFSGVVRRAFRAIGHDAWSCDLLPAKDNSPYHFKRDVLELLQDRLVPPWDVGIFHPPCTFILNSGCKHLYMGMKRWNENGSENPRDPNRWSKMESGARFFKACLDAPIPQVACENPIMVGYALKIVGRDYTQLIQPWQFGHTETKATCLWLRNLKPLTPTKNVRVEMMRLPRRERERECILKALVPIEDFCEASRTPALPMPWRINGETRANK